MKNPGDIVPQSANLKATAILDIDHEEVRKLAEPLIQADQPDRTLLQRAHLWLSQMVRPVYSVDEWQPVSKTLQKNRVLAINGWHVLKQFRERL